MNKTKLLMPMLGLATLSSVTIPLVSCGCNDKSEKSTVIENGIVNKTTKEFSTIYALGNGYYNFGDFEVVNPTIIDEIVEEEIDVEINVEGFEEDGITLTPESRMYERQGQHYCLMFYVNEYDATNPITDWSDNEQRVVSILIKSSNDGTIYYKNDGTDPKKRVILKKTPSFFERGIKDNTKSDERTIYLTPNTSEDKSYSIGNFSTEMSYLFGKPTTTYIGELPIDAVFSSQAPLTIEFTIASDDSGRIEDWTEPKPIHIDIKGLDGYLYRNDGTYPNKAFYAAKEQS